jgi:hypothetical protein
MFAKGPLKTGGYQRITKLSLLKEVGRNARRKRNV